MATAVLTRIAAYADEAGVAYPSLETLATETKSTERSVRRAISELRTLGVLSVTRRGFHRSNAYAIHVGVLERMTGHQSPLKNERDRTPGVPSAER